MKKIITILGVVILLAAIPATIFLVRQQQELRKKAAPATTLSLSPATLTKEANDTFSLDVTINSGENQVVVAELHLVFDPTKLEAQTITNSTLFPNILTSGVVDAGTASITVGAADALQPVTGTGSVAVIRFKALDKTDAPTSIRFAPTTFVGGLGEGATNILVGSNPATLTITESGNGTTLTPTPTPLAGGSPTVSLTPTPIVNEEATNSALQIISPSQDEAIGNTSPDIEGYAPAGATVTLTIYSTPKTVVVTADEDGYWSYSPDSPLESGIHNIVASTNVDGETVTATSSFVIAAGADEEISDELDITAEVSTNSAIPIAGTISTTLFLITIAIGFMVIGTLIPLLFP